MNEVEVTSYKINADVYIDADDIQDAEDLLAWVLYNHPHVVNHTQALGTKIMVQQDLSDIFAELEAIQEFED